MGRSLWIVVGAAVTAVMVGGVRTKASYGDKATIAAEYRVGEQTVRVDVRTELAGDTWRLLDTLAMPVLIRSNMPTLDHAKIGDVEVPVSTELVGQDESRTMLLYPGEYTVQGSTGM
jgi:hypothetical protein